MHILLRTWKNAQERSGFFSHEISSEYIFKRIAGFIPQYIFKRVDIQLSGEVAYGRKYI